MWACMWCALKSERERKRKNSFFQGSVNFFRDFAIVPFGFFGDEFFRCGFFLTDYKCTNQDNWNVWQIEMYHLLRLIMWWWRRWWWWWWWRWQWRYFSEMCIELKWKYSHSLCLRTANCRNKCICLKIARQFSCWFLLLFIHFATCAAA